MITIFGVIGNSYTNNSIHLLHIHIYIKLIEPLQKQPRSTRERWMEGEGRAATSGDRNEWHNVLFVRSVLSGSGTRDSKCNNVRKWCIKYLI